MLANVFELASGEGDAMAKANAMTNLKASSMDYGIENGTPGDPREDIVLSGDGSDASSAGEEFDDAELAELGRVIYRLHLSDHFSAEMTGDGVWRSNFPGFETMLNTVYSPERFEDVRWDARDWAAEVAAEKLGAKLDVLSERKMRAEGEGEWFIGKDGKKRDIAY